MNLAILIAQLLLKYGPDVAASVQRMLSSGKEVAQADWDALFLKASRPYASYIDEAQRRADSNQ